MPPALGIYGKLLASLHAGEGIVCCRIVETKGSSPQKPGACMLVSPSGEQWGTLGGGCVEAEVKRRALVSSALSSCEVLRFDLDNDYGWDDGLICGGRIHVLIERPAKPDAYFKKLAELEGSGVGFSVLTAFEDNPLKLPIGATWLLDDALNVKASRNVSGPLDNNLVTASVQELSQSGRPASRQGLSWFSVRERRELVIIGGGHIGQAVALLAADLDFSVTVVEDREEFVTEARFPKAEKRLAGPLDRVLQRLEISSRTYCLIVTRGHNHDEQALALLLPRGAAYLGMIGSRRKIRLIFDDLIEQGVREELLEQVFAPVGIDIGSQTVAEIAVSIAAELVAHRNLAGRVPGRPEPALEQK